MESIIISLLIMCFIGLFSYFPKNYYQVESKLLRNELLYDDLDGKTNY